MLEYSYILKHAQPNNNNIQKKKRFKIAKFNSKSFKTKIAKL